MAKMIYRVKKSEDYKKGAKERIEKAEDNLAHVYVDVGGVPTVGNGKALVVFGHGNKWRIDPEGEAIVRKATGQGFTPEQEATLQRAADNLNQTRPHARGDKESMTKAREANVPMFYTSDVSTSPGRQGYRERTYQPEKSTFGIRLNEEEIEVFAEEAYQKTEAQFDRTMQRHGIEVPPSQEREALISIYHQNPSVLSNKGVVEAIKSKDREKLIQALEDPDLLPKNPAAKERRMDDINAIGRPTDPAIIRYDNNPQAELENQIRTPPRGTPNQKPGQPVPQPMPQSEPIGPSYEPNPTTLPHRPTVLDGIGAVLGQAGQAIATAGRATFDMAMGLGKETLQQALQLALTQSSSQDTLKQAAQLAMGNMLASLNAQIMAKVQQAGRPIGIAGPLQNPEAVEDFMNSPRNQGVFEKLAEEVQRLLRIYPDLDVTTVLVDRGLKHVRQGDFQIPGTLLLPDFMPMDRKDGEYIEILGVQLPVKIPPIIVVDGKIEENPQDGKVGLPIEFGGLEFSRGGDGAIEVRSYTREGATVRGHTRSSPDDDVSNNLSFRVKA